MPNKQEKNRDKKLKKIKPKRKHIIDAMLFLEATSVKNPIQLEQLALDLSLYRKRFEHLIKNRVILLVPDREEDSYYLDYDYYQKFQEKENKRFFITLVSIVIPGFILLLLGIAWLFI